MLRVLIAEDGRFSLRVIERALAGLGHQCESARDGAEALGLLTSSTFQVLVTDWDMPRMDGLELCGRVRQAGLDGYTYVIVLTARDRVEDKQAALEAGADDFLTKPLDPVELAARLRVAARILGWEGQLRQVNDALLRRTQELARVTQEIDALRLRAEYEATHDALTGTLDRRAWFRHIQAAPPTAVAIVDIDHFKRVNDRHGHAGGDAVLREVCDTLVAAVSNHGTVGRLGGEEFGIAFDCPFPEALAVAEMARERIRAAGIAIGEEVVSVSVSAGVSIVGNSLGTACREADDALYLAKAAGRDRVVAAPIPWEAAA